MGQMYAWATPEYLLDAMSLEQVFHYFERGVEFEEMRARLLVATLGEAMDPQRKAGGTATTTGDQTPDKAAFYEHYGDRIVRPGGSKGGE